MDNYDDIKEIQKKAAVAYVFIIPLSVAGFAYIGYLIHPIAGTIIGGFLGIIIAMVLCGLFLLKGK